MTRDIRSLSSPKISDTHISCQTFGSGAFTTCFYDLNFWRIGFEHPTLRMRGELSYRFGHNGGIYYVKLAKMKIFYNPPMQFIRNSLLGSRFEFKRSLLWYKGNSINIINIKLEMSIVFCVNIDLLSICQRIFFL